MQFDAETIISFVKEHKAQQVSDGLPDKVDTNQHARLLSTIGVDPKELLGKPPGSLGDELGGIVGMV